MVAAKLANMERGANQHSEGTSIEGASNLLNVGRASVERAKTVQREAIPELQHEVERGGVSVSAAADLATKPKEEQREIVARGEKEILEPAKAIRAEIVTGAVYCQRRDRRGSPSTQTLGCAGVPGI